MQISNMLLENLKGKALQEIASAIWIDEQTTKALASIGLPLLLVQLEQNASTHAGADKINDALNKHLWDSKIDISDGAKILSYIFSNSWDTISLISKQTGKSKDDTLGVMSALSSILMETLWDQKKAAGWFETSEIMKLLSWTGKDVDILGMVMDEPRDDASLQEETQISTGMKFLKNLLTKKK
jgi:hypothetical protein